MKELQALVAKAVADRGYRQGWTDEQFAARQICKAAEKLGELAETLDTASSERTRILEGACAIINEAYRVLNRASYAMEAASKKIADMQADTARAVELLEPLTRMRDVPPGTLRVQIEHALRYLRPLEDESKTSS